MKRMPLLVVLGLFQNAYTISPKRAGYGFPGTKRMHKKLSSRDRVIYAAESGGILRLLSVH